MTQPIDYARADVAVVRKKFRRRVVMFVIATVVVMGIGCVWLHSSLGGWWRIGYDPRDGPVGYSFVNSYNGWFVIVGPERKKPVLNPVGFYTREVGSDIVGIKFWQTDLVGFWSWQVAIRYRTLFILAMIPWIITLIRMIRVWKRKRVFETEPRTQ